MSRLNIKNLWIQQIKTNEENTIEPVEIKVTDVEVELNEEETRIYERMMEKIKKNSEEVREINVESTEEVLDTEIIEEEVVGLNIEGITETFNITENINNMEEIIERNRNNIMEENYERSSRELTEEISENNQMEDEENLSEELSELEDEPPKINRKRKHENESQEAMKRRMIEKKSEIVKELIQELETPTLREEEITEEIEEESSRQDDINKLVKMFHGIERINKKQMRRWYEYGRKFEQKVEEIKNQKRKRVPDKMARNELYNEMRDRMSGNTTREAIRKRTRRAIKIYEFFTEIGSERMNRIKDCTVDTIIKLNEEDIKQIKDYFKKR